MHKPTKRQLRRIIRDGLDGIAKDINAALRGERLADLETVLSRVGRGKQAPHWYAKLKDDGTLPNLDGKTIGSVVEMLLVAVLETKIFSGLGIRPLCVNPARGVDLPDLDLGVKSPSENYCTSEPFFSAYERLLGSEFDIVVLLTDYQTAKRTPPLRLQIVKWRYLKGTQIADQQLCRIARAHRKWLFRENESWAKKVFCFLAYINQNDWRARRLLKLIEVLPDEEAIGESIEESIRDFEAKNRNSRRADKLLIPDTDMKAIHRVLDVSPVHVGVIDAAHNWVVETQKEAGRMPNENEWQRLKRGPLDGLIRMSFALQWRYNFGRLFNSDCHD